MKSSKIGVIGAGNVGAAIVYALVLRNIGKEIIFFNRNKDRAVGEAMDIDDCVPLLSEMKIKATNSYEDLKSCSVIAVTIGARQKEGESRLELLGRNASLVKECMREIDKVNKEAVIIVVSNPVDILTRVAIGSSKRDKNLIFGSGTILDTSRLRFQVGKTLDINRKNIHLHVVGEHGDSEFAIWSSAMVGSIKLDEYPMPKGVDLESMKKESMEIVKKRAYKIIEKKGYTNYGVGVAVAKLIQCVVRDEKKILPVSVEALDGYRLKEGVVLSLPSIIGSKGVEKRLLLSYNKEEERKLLEAAKSLDETYESILE